MTFDDGILWVYRTENTAENGAMPRETQTLFSEHYFGYDVLGFSRYYTALQADQSVSAVVNIPGWHDISVLDAVTMEDGQKYLIRLCQPMKDENGLNITKLTLERVINGA